mmetsp:Transcript_27626/g.67194  ORF Transcript_27626/g.67194 Transcript_27626/m.67194 type:complete len:101 (+) Transcript_27626:224-526(+)
MTINPARFKKPANRLTSEEKNNIAYCPENQIYNFSECHVTNLNSNPQDKTSQNAGLSPWPSPETFATAVVRDGLSTFAAFIIRLICKFSANRDIARTKGA